MTWAPAGDAQKPAATITAAKRGEKRLIGNGAARRSSEELINNFSPPPGYQISLLHCGAGSGEIVNICLR